MAVYSGPLIDVDVHHRPKSDTEHLEYVPARSRALAESYVRNGVGFRAVRAAIGLNDGQPPGGVPHALTGDGTPTGSSYVARHLPAAWQTKVFYENACRLLGWQLPAETVKRERALAAA